MAFAHSHLQAAERILSGFDGRLPFPAHARTYFRDHKQHGGRDRKAILAICYAIFRLGASLDDHDLLTRTVAGLFLTLESPDRTLQELDAAWNGCLPMALPEKLKMVKERHADFNPLNIFPWTQALGADIDPMEFCLSHLVQPALYARIRPGKEKRVLFALKAREMPFERIGDFTIRLPQGTDLSGLFVADRDIVVQDLASQQIAELLTGWEGKVSRAWDCCAGSGGKSILLHDLHPGVRISASDLRPSMLSNLDARFKAADIHAAETFTADLERSGVKGHGSFDIVLADVPCTGSGTWGRNPEWLKYFDASQIAAYAARQTAIARHAALSVKPGGHFIYVTCSVFRLENEGVVASLEGHAGLQLEEKKYMKGYGERADTLFAARFISRA